VVLRVLFINQGAEYFLLSLVITLQILFKL
jgi:hypothetical protein